MRVWSSAWKELVTRFRALLDRARASVATANARLDLCALSLLVGGLFALLAPMLEDFSTYGFHDWDAHSAYRYITALSLGRYGEGPWWHPYLCGGVPAWGYVEGAPNLVSPYLPFYLFADIRTAIRIEVLGNGLIGMFGTYLLARRFTRSPALAAFVAALYGLNGRWALQAAVGHTWHLQYAILPWILYCFERAINDLPRGAGSFRERLPTLASAPVLSAGALFAYMVYAGAIYPLPHSVLLVGLYLTLRALAARSLEPLLGLALAGFVAVGLSAPKLFAVLEYMQGAPRLIVSNERIGLAELVVMLTDRSQRYGAFPVRVPAYNWHEWGLYVGITGLLALLFALLFASGARGQSLKICGFVCLLLGFGAFHEYAPWTLLHELPPFSSQHVPSRFHYPMVLFLGLAFADTASSWVARMTRGRPWREGVALVGVGLFVIDLVQVNHVPFAQAFWMRAPATIPHAEPFEQRTDAPVHYVERDWAAPMLLAMFANTGVIRCYGADPSLTPHAIARDAPGYRGLAYVADGPGRAEVVEWTPNRAVVRVHGARPGALVVYDMNFDRGWSADGEPALSDRGRVAARLRPGADSVRFSYFPRTLRWSLPVFLITVASVVWIARRRPRAERSRQPT